MSPSPAAPSTASTSACASTSPSEWPARPAVVVEPHAAEHERHAALERVRVDADPDPERHGRAPPAARRASVIRIASGGGSLQEAPRPAADVHADHAGGERRADVVVDAIAHVRDLARLDVRPARRPARRTPERASRRPSARDEPTKSTWRAQIVLDERGRVAGRRRRGSRPRAAARGTGARRGYQSSSVQVPAGCSMPSSSQTRRGARPSAIVAPRPAISVKGGTPPRSATRVHMLVSSTSVSPTSNTTTPTATRPPARGRRASSP